MKYEIKQERNYRKNMASKGLAALLGIATACSGCATYGPSVISDARLRDFSEDRTGNLFYRGEKVYQLELERPAYIKMLPNNKYQWGFTAFTFVAGLGTGAAVSGGGSKDSGSSTTATTPATTVSTGSGGSYTPSTTTSTQSTQTSGGNTSGGTTPPASSGGNFEETPNN